MIRSAPEINQALSAVTTGKYVFYNGHLPICKVTVTGETPATGKLFYHDLTSGVICQRDETVSCREPYGSTLDKVVLRQEENCGGLSSLSGALSGCAVKDFFEYLGDMYRVVDVKDENEASIAPGAGNVWVHQLTASAVTELADTTTVERRPGTPEVWILV
jgi:hypothetical protein